MRIVPQCSIAYVYDKRYQTGSVLRLLMFLFIFSSHRKRQRNQRHSGQASRTTPNVLITRENGHTHMSSPSDHLSSDSPGSEKYLRPERKGNSVQGVYHYDFVVCGFNRMDSR
jgi:hypothetical protein